VHTGRREWDMKKTLKISGVLQGYKYMEKPLYLLIKYGGIGTKHEARKIRR
jgi:hypothetical protein